MLAFSHLFHITFFRLPGFVLFSAWLFLFCFFFFGLFFALCVCWWQGKQVGHLANSLLPAKNPPLTCRLAMSKLLPLWTRGSASVGRHPCNKFIFKLLIEYYLLNLQALNVNVSGGCPTQWAWHMRANESSLFFIRLYNIGIARAGVRFNWIYVGFFQVAGWTQKKIEFVYYIFYKVVVARHSSKDSWSSYIVNKSSVKPLK